MVAPVVTRKECSESSRKAIRPRKSVKGLHRKACAPINRLSAASFGRQVASVTLAAVLSIGIFSSTAFAQQPPSPTGKAATPAAPAANPEHERLKVEAEGAYQNGDFVKCVELTGKVLAQNPRDHVALYLRASARVELGQVRRELKEVRAGIEDAREAMRQGGTDAINYYLPYFYGMTALAQMEGRKEHAEVVVSFAGQVLQRPTLKPEEKANLLYQRANAQMFLTNLEGAATDFDTAVTLSPTHLGARIALADCYFRQGKLDKAEAAYTGAVNAVPNNPLVYNNRGMFFQQQGKTAQAVADFTRAIEIDKEYAVAYTNRGFAAMSEANPQAAEADFSQALKIDPSQPLVYSLRGTSRLSQGNPAGAIEDYSQVLKIDPRNPIANADLGFAKYFAGDFAGAVAAFDQAVALDPNLRYLNPWRFWAITKAGQPGAAAQKAGDSFSKPADKHDWVDHLLHYLAGKKTEQELVNAAEPKDAALKAAQLCEAYYFMAEKRAQLGDTVNATNGYQQAMSTKQAHLSAYRGSQFALKSFGKANP